MTLNAQVVAIEHESRFVDGMKRVTFRLEGADEMFREIRLKVPNIEHGYFLGQKIAVLMMEDTPCSSPTSK